MASLYDRLTRLFFAYFFRFLLLGVSIAEWICAAQIVRLAAGPLPRWTYPAGAAGVYFLNRLLIRIPQDSAPAWQRAGLRLYSAAAFTSMFGFAFLVLHAVVWELVKLLAQSTSLAAGGPRGAVASFALPFSDWTSAAGLIAIGSVFLYGYTVGQRRLEITRCRILLRRAAPALDGVRIVQISDIHLGRYMSGKALAKYVEKVNRLDPDLLVITGDLVDSLSAIPDGFPALSGLRARYGVLAVLGNHDAYAGTEQVAAALRRYTSFTLLRDQIATVHINGAPLHFAGVDDRGKDWARGVDFHPALARLLPDMPHDGPIVLLSHRPDLFPQAAAAGIDLVLTGHTHGGQLSLPVIGRRPLTVARFITRYDRGLYREGDSCLYVNRGLGCTGQRIRLFTPRDISIIEIATPESQAQAA